MFEQAESVMFSPEIEKLQEQLQKANQEMEMLAKHGKYVLAESIRQNAEKIKQDLEVKRQEELSKRHRQEAKEVKKYLRQDLEIFHKEWDKKIKDHQEKTEEMKKVLREKHLKELESEKERLEKEISEIGKESSELLNLRKIEQNLAKQHNFVEAHLVQKQVKELVKKEEVEWFKDKQAKIQMGLTALKVKQEMEMKALQKKMNSEMGELELERTKAEAQLTLKHSVMKKCKQSQARKENLMMSGELKSKIDVVSPGRSMLSPSKSRVLSASRSWNLLPTMTR